MNKHLQFLEFQENINQNIKGGFNGLEVLFNKHISKLKSNKFILSHSNFIDFYNGKHIEILGIENYNTIKNNGKNETLEFDIFFETYCQFYNAPTPFDAFSSPYNILQESLNKIKKIFNNEIFIENEKISLLKEFLIYVAIEIKKSNECKEIDNIKLYPKLIYLKEGFITIYNEVWNVYGHFLNNFEKCNFDLLNNTWFDLKNSNSRSTSIKTNKKPDWQFVFIEITKGNIQIEKINNFDTEYSYKEQKFENPSSLGNHIAKQLNKKEDSIRPIITSSINGGDKDIFSKKKLKVIKELIEENGDLMCPFFKDKLSKLI